MAFGYLGLEEAKKRRHAYYVKNRVKFVAAARARQDMFRRWIQAQKEASPCTDCREFYPFYVMDYDHRGDHPKTYGIALLYRRASWVKIKAEIAKCDLVCSNCHRIRTHKRLSCQIPANDNSKTALSA
jgi:hypothetical protein